MSDIKKYFKSRFGDNGYIIEADYSQLEIYVLAYLSQDPVLMGDLTSGIDLHRKRASEWLNKDEADVTDTERKTAKALSFQLQYGSGYKAMAKSCGIFDDQAQAFIDAYYNRYKGVKQWQKKQIAAVEASRKPSEARTASKLPAGRGTLETETGRTYVFYESDNPYYNPDRSWNKAVNFSPTKIINYPVQGLATGDIVPLILGKLYRKFITMSEFEDKFYLVNTVHDSIILDTHEDMLYTICSTVKQIMEGAPEYLKDWFDIDFNLPLQVEIKYGKNWLELTEEYTGD